MSTTPVHAMDLNGLRPGDRLEAFRDGYVHHRGVVEETVPDLGVVWVRATGTGERHMVTTADFELRRG